MMNELDPMALMPFLFIGYVDVGTGQVIASSIGPILAAGISFFLGILGFFLLRFKKIFKKFRRRPDAPEKSDRSRS